MIASRIGRIVATGGLAAGEGTHGNRPGPFGMALLGTAAARLESRGVKRYMSQATGCTETVELLNAVFQTYFIFNDGHEILSRLRAGDNVVEIVQGLNQKFGRREYRPLIRALGNAWPPEHLEAITTMVRWALEKLDTDDRVMIEWKGDATQRETVTKFELRDHLLTIEFAHAPRAFSVA